MTPEQSVWGTPVRAAVDLEAFQTTIQAYWKTGNQSGTEVPSMHRLDHLKNLVIMAAADGSLNEQEISLLIDRCSHLGLQEEDLEKAISYALSGDAKMRLPVDRVEQNLMLSELIRMMAADGKLLEVEKRLFALAAAKMGIDRKDLDTLIDELLTKPSR